MITGKAGAVKAFTLIELVIVVMIVAILAALALPLFEKTRERTYDKEATANLKLIQAAERIYAIEFNAYFFSADVSQVNTHLRLSLPSGNKRLWDYQVGSASGGNEFEGRAVRYNCPSWQRTWFIDDTLEDATCESGPCVY